MFCRGCSRVLPVAPSSCRHLGSSQAEHPGHASPAPCCSQTWSRTEPAWKLSDSNPLWPAYECSPDERKQYVYRNEKKPWWKQYVYRKGTALMKKVIYLQEEKGPDERKQYIYRLTKWKKAIYLQEGKNSSHLIFFSRKIINILFMCILQRNCSPCKSKR